MRAFQLDFPLCLQYIEGRFRKVLQSVELSMQLCIVYVESKQVCIYSQKVVLVTHVVCTWIGFVQKCIVKHYFYSILQFVLKFTISILFEKCKNLSKVIETLLSTTTLIFKKDSNCLQENQFLFILCVLISFLKVHPCLFKKN